jgi:DNA polymerase zeta
VKGVHFYGFHAQHSPFLKIYFIDPAVINRAAAIMQSGTIMATRFRTYESHLGFILQFMCDFNLYGCGWINLQKVFLRGAEQLSEGEESRTRYDLTPSPYYCQSRVPLEVDVAAPHILNRHHLERREIHNKLQIPASSISNGPLISSVRELWDDERKRRLARGLDPSPEMPMDPSESSRKPGGGWIAEVRLWDELSKRILRESDNTYESPRQEWEEWTMSAFESIEAVWQREYRVWTPLKRQTTGRMEERLPVITDPIGSDEDVGIQVDVEMLSSQEVVQRLQLEEESITEVADEDACDEVEDTADHLEEQSHLSRPGRFVFAKSLLQIMTCMQPSEPVYGRRTRR